MIAAHQCYAMTATTALTAQNTQGVLDIHYVPSAFVSKQIDACVDDIGVDVIKIGVPGYFPRFSASDLMMSPIAGMLASVETVDAVAQALEKHGRPTCVLDPVFDTAAISHFHLTVTGNGGDNGGSAPAQRRRHQHPNTTTSSHHRPHSESFRGSIASRKRCHQVNTGNQLRRGSGAHSNSFKIYGPQVYLDQRRPPALQQPLSSPPTSRNPKICGRCTAYRRQDDPFHHRFLPFEKHTWHRLLPRLYVTSNPLLGHLYFLPDHPRISKLIKQQPP